MIDIADSINVLEPISRLPGAGEVSLYGSQYAMRIWCDPDKFEQYGLTPSDVATAIRAQNAQVSAGQIGALPVPPGQEINLSIEAVTRMETTEQFENIILRADRGGSVVYLKDVATIKLNNETFGTLVTLNGKPAAGLGIRQTTGANALETAEANKAELEKMSGIVAGMLTATLHGLYFTPLFFLTLRGLVKGRKNPETA